MDTFAKPLQSKPDRDWLWVLAALAVTRLISICCFYLYDDSFITFRYATNLINGLGFTYNPGEVVQGTTSPLWALLLALPYGLGMGIELSSRIMGILADGGALWLMLWSLKRENQGSAAIAGGFLFAVDPYLSKMAAGGMESSLFLLGTVSAVLLVLTNRKSAAALVAALCVFVRPEALLLALCLIGFTWYEEKRFPWTPALIGTGVILAGVAVQWAYFGDLIPQSVRGKMGLLRTYEGLWNLVLFPRANPIQSLLTVSTLCFLPYAIRVSRFVRLYGLWTAVLFGSWLVTGAHLWMWYCVPVYFFKTVVTGIGAARYFPSFVAQVRPWIAWMIVVIGWGAFAVLSGPDKMQLNVYDRIRQWAADKDFQGQTAYAMDFGAIGFYTGLRIIDEPGLVWPKAITTYRTDPKAILLGEKPDWAYVTCYDGNMEMMRSRELQNLYDPVARFSVKGETDLWPELKDVPQEWVRDFILYKRR